MIKKYTIELIFLLSGLLLFGGSLLEENSLYNFSDNTYFLSNDKNYINSIRDFSVGVAPHINSIEFNNIDVLQININYQTEDLFGYKNGVYTLGDNYYNNQHFNSKSWWEQEANYKRKGYFSETNVDVTLEDSLSFATSFKINGNNTRAYPQKSFRIKDNKELQNKWFGELRSDWLIFRNSGNDWDRTMFSDPYCSHLVSELNLISSKSKPVYVFFNSTFWGLYNIRQRIDEKFIANYENIKTSKIFLYENNSIIKYGDSRAKKSLNKLKKTIKEKSINDLKLMIDEDNFIDYIVIETFLNNTDWPNNNVLYYKTDFKSSKFKFIPKDLDYSMAYTSNFAYKNNSLQRLMENESSIISKIFSILITDKNFKLKFKQRAYSLLENELKKETLLLEHDKFRAQYQSLIQHQIDRWRYPKTISDWNQNCQLNRSFLERRGEFYKSFIELF